MSTVLSPMSKLNIYVYARNVTPGVNYLFYTGARASTHTRNLRLLAFHHHYHRNHHLKTITEREEMNTVLQLDGPNVIIYTKRLS
ncbi:hypothetical protein L873DRAFT_442836 [Choiromyces venosus 120613-1]|uniref:Uncharacterized protein n=1 Tax=Choiromyces venosus 120613-1 TaxID=1336337 RepID=A0A3N4IZF3_9PEZI|nr:hypothetical protein L873DRAFT_442836 [Choiromyces venosus 120613-1]